MAIFHARIQVIGRSAGRSVVAAAAYRAAQCLQDEKLGRAHDFTAKTGVVHSEIMLPAGAPARWNQGEMAAEQHAARTTLWNEVEAREKRCDAQLAREMEFAIPRELPQAKAIELAREFVREQFVDRGMAADLNVHWDVGADGQAKPHAHVLLTMRQVTPDGFGPKVREWNSAALYEGMRERWAALANERLAQLGHDVRIDHRSYAEQGIALEPQHKIGPAGARRAVRGEPAERAAEHVEIARRNGEAILADPGVVLDAITRQHSTFTRADLARFVNRHTADGEQFARAMAVVEASPELVRLGEDGRGRSRLTTREMLAVEQRMERTSLALSRRQTHGVLLERRRAVAAEAGLGDEQRAAFGHLTRSRDLSVLVGIAGGGKTTLLGAARRAWEAEGYRVRGATLSGIAAEGLEAGSGIESRTLASLEWGWKEGRDALTARDVLVVDEAGMVGSRQMERVLGQAEAAGAKVVLVGDPEQLQAIEAGAAFRAIAERVGAAEILETRRQRVGWQREATRELATGRTAAALLRYETAGMVHGHGTSADARVALIVGWDRERRAAPEQSRVILAYTRADAQMLNHLARERLRAAGELGAEQAVQTERGERRFSAGDRLMFLRNERGLGAGPGGRGGVAVKNGTLGTVLAVEGEGTRLTVRLDRAGGGGVSAPEVTFSVGDYAALEHGYAATMHKGQGVTADRAHVLASAHMDRHAAYVALSRHRDGVSLHWSADELGSREGLARVLGRERAKDTSLDYGDGAEPEAAGLAPELARAERTAAAYAERRGVVPVGEVAAGDGPAGPRLAARTALLLNRMGALQLDGAVTLQGHAARAQAGQAAGEVLPGLQPRFRHGRALRVLETSLAASARLAEQGVASAERMATALGGLPELLRGLAERMALRQEAMVGAAGWRERYATQRRQAALEVQARGLVGSWDTLIAAYGAALPGLARDPGLQGTRAALVRFGASLREQPDAVAVLQARGSELGLDARPNFARVLASHDPKRTVMGQLDGYEAQQRAHLKQEAEKTAARLAQEQQLRPSSSHGMSM